MQINPEIFRSYDIRGIVGPDIDKNVAEKLGKSFGSYIQEFLNESKVMHHFNHYGPCILTNNLINS